MSHTTHVHAHVSIISNLRRPPRRVHLNSQTTSPSAKASLIPRSRLGHCAASFRCCPAIRPQGESPIPSSRLGHWGDFFGVAQLSALVLKIQQKPHGEESKKRHQVHDLQRNVHYGLTDYRGRRVGLW